jgi:uncharacterized membrane protein YvbJ
MNKTIITVASLIGTGAVIIALFAASIGYSNSEKRQRNLITAKQRDNHSELDNMMKVIGQTAQVSQEQMKMLKDIIIGHAQARSGNGGGSLATLVREVVPNIDVKTFNNLQNIIVASRNSWTQRQKELLDMKRVHDNLIDTAPSSWVVGSRGKIDVQIVTSSKAEAAFEAGKDDDTDVFKK